MGHSGFSEVGPAPTKAAALETPRGPPRALGERARVTGRTLARQLPACQNTAEQPANGRQRPGGKGRAADTQLGAGADRERSHVMAEEPVAPIASPKPWLMSNSSVP